MKQIVCRLKLVRHCFLEVLGGLALATISQFAFGQSANSAALIPLFHDRVHQHIGDERLQLMSQRVVVFVYHNAAAVYLDAHFVNTESDSLTHELALPSKGHTSAQSGTISNGILGVKLWIAGERVEPSVDEGKETWYTIAPAFGSHEEKHIRALFWVQTSLADVDSVPSVDSATIHAGKRVLVVDLQHAAAWKDVVQSLDVSMVLREGLTKRNSRMDLEPKNYLDDHSTFFWSLQNVEPSFSDDISIVYTPPTAMASHWNTMAKLSDYITGTVYDELLGYVQQLDEE
ncbi:MAG: hypothetical protein HY033_09025 [Ignavibacteriae bacterium]|nr:hypothetical protein [Ignavibacteria bacterium]MBI3365033.1 hypothetical protein [Ignavibacteriota bacterium]